MHDVTDEPSNPLEIAVSYWLEEGNQVKQEARERLENSSSVILNWLDPEQQHQDLHHNGVDLYHMSKHREGSTIDVKGFEENGTAVLNPEDAVERANDRLRSARILEAYGVPVPEWEYGHDDEITLESPVIAKSRFESLGGGHDHRTFSDGEEISYDGEKLVQEYHDGDTLKGYRIPHEQDRPQIFAEMMNGHRKKGGEEVTPSRGIRGIVDRVHEAMDLEMFEVDVVLTDQNYHVVDVNPFVGLRGVNSASQLYSDVLVDQASMGREETVEKEIYEPIGLKGES